MRSLVLWSPTSNPSLADGADNIGRVHARWLRLLVLSCMLVGWLQEVIVSDCNGLLGAVAYLLSHCTSAISMAAEQHSQPSSAQHRAALQGMVLELEEQCAALQVAAVSILRCLREHALRSSIDAHMLLHTLDQLLSCEVMPTATCA